jgi:hypothetical protein
MDSWWIKWKMRGAPEMVPLERLLGAPTEVFEHQWVLMADFDGGLVGIKRLGTAPEYWSYIGTLLLHEEEAIESTKSWDLAEVKKVLGGWLVERGVL